MARRARVDERRAPGEDVHAEEKAGIFGERKMGVGIFNVIIGIVAIVGALQGRTMIFSNDPNVGLVLGGVIVAFGLYQIVRSRPR